MENARIAVVDQQKLLRLSISTVLENLGFPVVAELGSIDTLLRRQDEAGPVDIVLATLTALRETRPETRRGLSERTRLVVMADNFFLADLRACLRLGAKGFLLTRLGPAALTHSLKLVIAGETVFPTELSSILLSREVAGGTLPGVETASPPILATTDADGEDPLLHRGLTRREKLVLVSVMNGDSNKAIARSLNCTEDMVKVSLKQIMKKINVKNRTQAALWGMQIGLRLAPDP